MTEPFRLAFAALFGAIAGSFLNVCIYRLPRNRSVVWPASACTSCGRALAWYENVPVLSWLALRGRCRTCRASISIQYPIVEAITAAMFAAGWWYYGPGVLLASRLVFGCLLIVLFGTDLEHQILPNVVTLPGIAAGFAFSFFTAPGWQSSLAGIVVGGGVLLATAYAYFWIRRQEGLGMGDFKMLAMIGAFVGWQLTLVTLMCASFAGAFVGIGLMAAGRGSMASKLPFGTFLALGAALAATIGPGLLSWYLGFWT
jgi:leader peptidase (prepilin peptidase)/N-methyltransferase